MSILRNRGYYITNSDPNLDNNIKDGVTDGATLCYDETNENFYIFKDSEISGSKWVLQESDTELWSLNGLDIYYNGGNVGIGTSTPSEELEVVGNVEADEFIGDLRGSVLFKAQSGEALSKGDVVYISGISGNTTVVSKADSSNTIKMPAFGIASTSASNGNPVDIYTFGTLHDIDTSSFAIGDELYVDTTAGGLVNTPPTGESSLIQKIGKVTRVHASNGSIKISGAGRTNATPNLNEGRLFVGNSSNKSVPDGTVYVDIANSKVGIGTTSPSEKLEVDGNIKATSFIKDSATSNDVLLGDGTTTSLSGISDGHSHSNKTVLDKFGEDGSGLPTYNGNLVDTTIAQRDVYDGLDSTDNTISLSANQGKVLKDAQDLKVDGSGTANYVSKWNDSNTLEDSVIYDDGTNVGIGTTSPSGKLTVKSDGFGTSYNDYSSIYIDNGDVTAGEDNYGNGIGFSRLGGSIYKKAAIVPVQGTADPDNLGLAFFTSPNGGFADAVTEAMRVDYNGNVGIGTTSPSAKLTIENDAGGAASTTYSTTAANSNLHLSAVGVPYYNHLFMGIGSATYSWIQSQHGNSSAQNLALNPIGGNVGIGTTSPTSPLHVVNTLGGWSAYINNDVGAGTQSGLLLDAGSSSSDFAMYVRNAAGSSDLFSIKGNGNIGIGTTSPSAKLHVYGDMILGGDGSDAILRFWETNNGWNIRHKATGNSLRFSNTLGGTDHVVFDEIGNVGIGTTSPSRKMEVVSSGGIVTVLTSTTGGSYISMEDSATTSDSQVRFGAIGDNAIIKSGGTTALTLNSSQNATFAGDVTVTEDIQVGGKTSADSSIISRAGDIQLRIGDNSVEHSPFVRLQGNDGTSSVYADVKLDSVNQKLVLNNPGISGGSIGTNPTTLDSSGNLDIDGDITASNFSGTSSGTNTGDQDLSGYALTSHNHNYILATDDRDVKPNATSVGSTIKGIQPFFTSLEGMTGSSGTNYQDLLVLDTYSDTTGGNANAITLDKSDGSMRIWNAVHTATSWGTAKRVWTDDDFAVAPTGTNTGDQDLSGYLLNTTDTLTGDLTVSSKIYLGDGGNGYFYSDSDGRTAFTGGEFYIQSGVSYYYNYATNQYHGGSSGDNHYFRGNELSGDDWSIDTSGNISAVGGVFTGNVGIGTTSSGSKLEVSSSGAEGILISKDTGTTSNSGRLFFETDTVSEGFSFLNSNGLMTIRSQAQAGATSGTTRVAIDGSGNVGIGTSSPSYKLDIDGDVRGNSFWFRTNTTSTPASTAGFYRPSLGSVAYGFNTNEFFRITDTGNVGIGTSSPNAKLDINNGASGNVASFKSGGNSAAGEYAGITLHQRTNNSQDVYGSEIRNILTASAPSFLNPRLGFFTQDNNTYLPADRTEKMSILGNGNVGIGTTSPSDKLHVIGNIKSTGTFIGNGSLLTNLNASNIATGTLPLGVIPEFIEEKYIYNSNDSNGVYMPMVKGGMYATTSSSVLGAIKVTLPSYKSKMMFTIYVDIYEYTTGETVTLRVSGYAYDDTGASWYSCSVVNIADNTDRDYTVRFYSDIANSNQYFTIGETNSTWSYPQVNLRDFWGGFNTSESEAKGTWDISFVTSFTGDLRHTFTDNFAASDWDRIRDKPSTFAPSTHNHDDRYYTESESDNRFVNVAGDTMTGSLGIGITSPRSILETDGTISINDSQTALTTADTLAGIDIYTSEFSYNPTSGRVNSPINRILPVSETSIGDAFGMAFYTADQDIEAAEVMRISSAGNVGIGSTSPSAKLEVFENNAPCTITIKGGLNAQTAIGDEIGSIDFRSNDPSIVSTDDIAARIVATSGWTNGAFADLKFYTADNTVSPYINERMIIKHDGNVGIGTTSPGQKLDVSGNIRGNNFYANHSSVPSLYMERGDGLPQPVIQLVKSNDNLLIGNTAIDEVIFYDDSGEAMRLDGTGKLGIGTTSPSTTLDVAGDIKYTTEGGTATRILGKDVNNKLTVTGVDSLVQAEVGSYINDRQFLAAIEADTTLASKYSLQFPTTIRDGYVTVSGTNDETLTLSDAGVYKITVDVVLDDGAVASASYSLAVQNGLTTVHFSKQNFYEQQGTDEVACQFTFIVELDDAIGYNLQLQNQALASAQILSGYAQIELLYLTP